MRNYYLQVAVGKDARSKADMGVDEVVIRLVYRLEPAVRLWYPERRRAGWDDRMKPVIDSQL
jgi:hypothetical protein